MIISAYYYPKMGMPLRISNECKSYVGSEWDLLNGTKRAVGERENDNLPLFEGADITCPTYVSKLVSWCRFYQIDSLTICWYWDNSEILLEDEIDKFVQTLGRNGISYSFMWVQRAPHEELPIKLPPPGTQYHPEIEFRKVVTSIDDLERMGEYLAEHFSRPNYLKLDSRPIFTVFELPNLERDIGQDKVRQAIDGFRETVVNASKADPLLIGVVHHHSNIFPLSEYGFDYASSYVFLPDWSQPFEQDYSDELENRVSEWGEIQKQSGCSYFPSATVGWKATFRGETLDHTPPQYPWSPVIINNSPITFSKYLQCAVEHLSNNAQPGRELMFVASMNEWSEGHRLEPSVKDGYQYLETIRRVKQGHCDIGHSFPNRPTVLVSDLDGTLVPEHPLETDGNHQSLIELRKVVDVLVYVTGRQLIDVVEDVLSGVLPVPDAIAADVGVTWWSANSVFSLEHPLAQRIEMFPYTEIKKRLADIEGLVTQGVKANQRVSYYVDRHVLQPGSVEKRLADLKVDLLWSRDYLDVLPAGVSKASVATTLCEQFSGALLFVAGNTLNDSHLLERYVGIDHIRVFANGGDPELWEQLAIHDNIVVPNLVDAAGVLEVIKGYI